MHIPHIAAAAHQPSSSSSSSCRIRISAKVVRMIMIESKIGMFYKWRGYNIRVFEDTHMLI